MMDNGLRFVLEKIRSQMEKVAECRNECSVLSMRCEEARFKVLQEIARTQAGDSSSATTKTKLNQQVVRAFRELQIAQREYERAGAELRGLEEVFDSQFLELPLPPG